MRKYVLRRKDRTVINIEKPVYMLIKLYAKEKDIQINEATHELLLIAFRSVGYAPQESRKR